MGFLKKIFLEHLILYSIVLIIIGLGLMLLGANFPQYERIGSSFFFSVGGSLLGIGIIDMIYRSTVVSTYERKQTEKLILNTVGAFLTDLGYVITNEMIKVTIDVDTMMGKVEREELGINMGTMDIKGRKREFFTYPGQDKFELTAASFRKEGGSLLNLLPCNQSHRKIVENDTIKDNWWQWNYPFQLKHNQKSLIKDGFNYGNVNPSDDYSITIKHPTRDLSIQISVTGGQFNTIEPLVYDATDVNKINLFEHMHPEKDIKVNDEGKIIKYSLKFTGTDIKIDRNFGFDFTF